MKYRFDTEQDLDEQLLAAEAAEADRYDEENDR